MYVHAIRYNLFASFFDTKYNDGKILNFFFLKIERTKSKFGRVNWIFDFFQRTKTKSEQDEWIAALWDARNNNLTCISRPRRDRKSSVLVEMHYRLTNCPSADSNGSCIISENHLRYGRTLKDSFDDIYFEVGRKNGIHVPADRRKPSRALRKTESDNRISFYRELHGLVRTDPATVRRLPVVSDKESIRSRSLSYESIYFKPQENACKQQPVEPAKSRSCRELVPKVTKRAPKVNRGDDCFRRPSKGMSRSVSFLRRRCDDDSDTDDYDYAEISSNRHKYATCKSIVSYLLLLQIEVGARGALAPLDIEVRCILPEAYLRGGRQQGHLLVCNRYGA